MRKVGFVFLWRILSSKELSGESKASSECHTEGSMFAADLRHLDLRCRKWPC